MSGACTGFLFHNRYRASIVMSRVGSFALGGAVAAITACSGMFLPMLIACSLFFLELLFAMFQVCDFVLSFSSLVVILNAIILHIIMYLHLVIDCYSGPTTTSASSCHPV